MKLVTCLFFLVSLSVSAQIYSPFRALRPIMKDPNQREAPSSVNNEMLGEGPRRGQQPGQSSPGQPGPAPVQPGEAPKPADIVAKIDAGLALSKIKLLGRVQGIKGTMFVTNLTDHSVAPHLQLAVCDAKGFQIGTMSPDVTAILPKDFVKVEVVATNGGAADLKVSKLNVR